jgi:hypothetical protein
VRFEFFSEAGIVASVVVFMFLSAFSPITFSARAETTRYPFKLTLTLERTVFTLGEPINITWTLTNVGEKNVQLYLSVDDYPDFMIRDENLNCIFGFSRYTFLAAFWAPDKPIAPGDNITRVKAWGQINDGNGLSRQMWFKQVPPGIYYVSGIFTSPTYAMTIETQAIRITIS